MIVAKCGTKHTQSGPKCCAGKVKRLKKRRMSNQPERVTDYVAIT